MDDFLEIDPKSLSDEALVEMIRALTGSEKHRSLVTMLMREQVLRALKDSGLSLKEIVRALTQSRVRKDAC